MCKCNIANLISWWKSKETWFTLNVFKGQWFPSSVCPGVIIPSVKPVEGKATIDNTVIIYPWKMVMTPNKNLQKPKHIKNS